MENGRYTSSNTPARILEIVSLIAKPSANPVSPRPATSAETSTPTVPSAVTIPATSNVTRAAIAINRTTGYSKSALVPAAKIA